MRSSWILLKAVEHASFDTALLEGLDASACMTRADHASITHNQRASNLAKRLRKRSQFPQPTRAEDNPRRKAEVK
jgi:hypothetical protein